MPTLRLVMGSGPELRTKSGTPPPLPLVFDEDSEDETFDLGGGSRGPHKKRRIAESDDDEEEPRRPSPKRGRGRPPRGSSRLPRRGSSRLSSRAVSAEADDAGTPAENNDDDEDEEAGDETLPRIPNGPWGHRNYKTIEGRTFQIEDDELKLEDDAVGETKIDRKGNLLGGRELSASTFTSPYRHDPERLYILAIDACRAVGFRDTALFFKRNPLLYKLICQQVEKDELIADGKLHPNLQRRPVTMITARSFYRTFGARVIIGGRHIRDDYYAQQSEYEGNTADEPAIVELYDPEIDSGTLAQTKLPEQRRTRTGFAGDVARTRPSNKTMASKTMLASLASLTGSRDARYGGTGAPPFRSYDPNSKTRRPASGLSRENWILMYARAVQQTNRDVQNWREAHPVPLGVNATVADQVAAAAADDAEREAEEAAAAVAKVEGEDGEAPARRRRARSPTRGIVDHHTGTPHVRLDAQPVRARLEQLAAVPDLEGDGAILAREGFATVVIEAVGKGGDDEEAYPPAGRPPWSVPETWAFRSGM